MTFFGTIGVVSKVTAVTLITRYSMKALGKADFAGLITFNGICIGGEVVAKYISQVAGACVKIKEESPVIGFTVDFAKWLYDWAIGK